jgi:hypothetical protein
MGRYLVPAAMVAAMLAFAVAALAAGLTPYRPILWQGAVSLAILGGIIPMIYAINLRIVPVFARRSWPGEGWPRLQVALAIAGAWTVFAGRAANNEPLVLVGSALALAGAIVFLVSLARLFRQPPDARPAPPLPYPEHAAIDVLATWFMRLAGLSLLVGLTVGVVTSAWRPGVGRWDLVWAHTMLVGFLLSMAAGVCYHTLARWTGRRWRSPRAIRLHFGLVALGLPVMLVALAADQTVLFAIAGPVQAAAIALFLVNIAPMLNALPSPTRPALITAMALFAVGVTLGASFAIDPILGVWLRLVHAEINLFGAAGLLISGIGYYFLPRLAGQPLRWPRLAPVQLGAIALGVGLSVAALGWRAHGHGPASLVLASGVVTGAGFLLFGIQVAGTFRPMSAGTVAALPFVARPVPSSGTGQQR